MFGLKTKAVLGVAVMLVGGGAAAYQTGVISVPDFGVQDRGDWRNVSNQSIGIRSTAWINNENPVKLNFSQLEVNFKLKMNGVKMAEGDKNGVAVEKGNQTLNVDTSLYQQKIPRWWVSHIKGDEKTNVAIQFGVHRRIFGFPLKINGIKYNTQVETDLEKTLSNAMDKMKGNYSGPAVAGVESTSTDIRIKGGSAEFGKVNMEKTVIDAQVRVHNPNSYPIPTPRLNGELTMNDIRLADVSSEAVRSLNDAKIDPGETRTVKFKAEIDNGKVDDWLTSHARAEERSSGNVKLHLMFELGGTEFRIPTADCDFDVQTGIFVDDQNASSSFEGCSTVGSDFTQDEDESSGDSLLKDDGENSSSDSGSLSDDDRSLLGTDESSFNDSLST